MNDVDMLAFLRAEFPEAGVERATVTTTPDKTTLEIELARPGLVIGKRGATLAALQEKLVAKLGGEVHVHLVEVRRPKQ